VREDDDDFQPHRIEHDSSVGRDEPFIAVDDVDHSGGEHLGHGQRHDDDDDQHRARARRVRPAHPVVGLG
jgi:hypothetical protein